MIKNSEIKVQFGVAYKVIHCYPFIVTVKQLLHDYAHVINDSISEKLQKDVKYAANELWPTG